MFKDIYRGVLRAGGLKKQLGCLQHSRQEPGFAAAFLWAETRTSTCRRGGARAGRKAAARSAGACRGACPVHAWVGQEWSHKRSEPLISRRKKKIPTVCHSAKGRSVETKKWVVVSSLQRGVQSTDVLMSSGSALRDITMMAMCGHTSVQTHRICSAALLIKVNPRWTGDVLMMCQCTHPWSKKKQSAILLIMAVHVRGGAIWGISVRSCQVLL